MKKSYWIAIAILGTVFLLTLLVGISLNGNWNNAGWGMMSGWSSGMMHGWGIGSFGWFGMILVWLIAIGFVALVVLGIVGLVRGFSSIGGGSGLINHLDGSQTSPHEILQRRYASGEITREQYLQIIDDMN